MNSQNGDVEWQDDCWDNLSDSSIESHEARAKETQEELERLETTYLTDSPVLVNLAVVEHVKAWQRRVERARDPAYLRDSVPEQTIRRIALSAADFVTKAIPADSPTEVHPNWAMTFVFTSDQARQNRKKGSARHQARKRHGKSSTSAQEDRERHKKLSSPPRKAHDEAKKPSSFFATLRRNRRDSTSKEPSKQPEESYSWLSCGQFRLTRIEVAYDADRKPVVSRYRDRLEDYRLDGPSRSHHPSPVPSRSTSLRAPASARDSTSSTRSRVTFFASSASTPPMPPMPPVILHGVPTIDSPIETHTVLPPTHEQTFREQWKLESQSMQQLPPEPVRHLDAQSIPTITMVQRDPIVFATTYRVRWHIPPSARGVRHRDFDAIHYPESEVNMECDDDDKKQKQKKKKQQEQKKKKKDEKKKKGEDPLEWSESSATVVFSRE